MKIISILPHIPANEIFKNISKADIKTRFSSSEFIDIDERPYLVGFHRLDWHHRWSTYIKTLSPDVEIECWRPYGNDINIVYKQNVDGILHKVFPSKSIRFKKIGDYETSWPLLNELKKEIHAGQIIIHFYGSNSPIIFWLLNKLKPYGIPVILQHLGWSFSYFEYKYGNNPLKLIPYYFQRKALKYVNLYLTASKVEEKFLHDHFPKLKVVFFLNGIDFSKLPEVTKKDARIKLNIPYDAKMILYVGRYYCTKNVGEIIKAYNSLKTQNENYMLFLVGGYRTDEYYQLAIDSDAQVVLRKDESIYQYFAAADIYLMPIKDRMHQDFGGFGIAPIESLAYNTPVVSSNLKHFSGTSSEMSEIGICIDDTNKLVTIIDKFFENSSPQYSRCREMAEKYYDLKKNSLEMIGYYKSLISQFQP